jgi:hypothetical protein
VTDPAPAVANRAGAAEEIVARCTVKDPSADQALIQLLHARFLVARKKSGVGAGKLSFESFARNVGSQADRLREKTGCDKVELRVVVVDRKVVVKARPSQ